MYVGMHTMKVEAFQQISENQYCTFHSCYRSNMSFCVVTVNFGTSSTGGGKHGLEGSSLRLSPR